MCLKIGKTTKAKIATESIKCFKVILCKKGDYRTPYQGSYISPGDIHESKIKIIKDFYQRGIEIGLHSFTNLTAAKRELKYFEEYDVYPNPQIVECIIPAGATYYKGKFEHRNDAYASNILVYPKSF